MDVRVWGWLLAGVGMLLSGHRAVGQLAITEVMASQSTPEHGEDYWELTNFGTARKPLASLWFADNTGIGAAYNLATLSNWEFIEPGQSIVFVRHGKGVLESPSDFRAWWGESRLPANLRVAVAPWSFGFSRERDQVRLWEVEDGRTNLVDEVEVAEVTPGEAFTCDPVTGMLRSMRDSELRSVIRAQAAPDYGSPGTTVGPVALTLARSPENVWVDSGTPATFRALAHGLPRPRYQWLFQGHPIPGATGASFTIPNATPETAGEYCVQISNGLATLASRCATLTVNLQPRCVMVYSAPFDLDAIRGQYPEFRVEAGGYPAPRFRWFFNEREIPGATNNHLQLGPVGDEDAGTYRVEVANPSCTTNVSAVLRVGGSPRLRLTEVMPLPSTNTLVPGHGDWFEITYDGEDPINLRGYRFDDRPGLIDRAIQIDRDLILRPGESFIGVSDMTAEAFRRWWGEDFLPEGLQIVTYPGNGFDAGGDLLCLWNQVARTDDEVIFCRDFGEAPPGVSFWFAPVLAPLGEPSRLGERGAFRAVEADDIGSPGWTSQAQRVVRPRVVSIGVTSTGLRLSWRAEPGGLYQLEAAGGLATGTWEVVATRMAVAELEDAVVPVGDGQQQFFRVRRTTVQP